ncbi:imm11 family protein [Bacillus toyonensis]|uniref:imm11 family protein n=1 Tax=Bacillus toyonensis TaxID=155322 RepID=UPI003D3034DA
MKIWELKSSTNDYQTFQLLNYEEDKKYFKNDFNSTVSLLDSWTAKFIEIIDEGYQSDCPIFWGKSGVQIISEKAKGVLEPLVGNNVEFLPLIHKTTNEKYYAIHVLRVLDALDINNTIFEKISSGLIIGCEKFVFIPSVVQNEMFFKLYINGNIYPNYILVSDEFRNAALESDLKGFEFVEIWDSEANM